MGQRAKGAADQAGRAERQNGFILDHLFAISGTQAGNKAGPVMAILLDRMARRLVSGRRAVT
jgi:hypothetical protein